MRRLVAIVALALSLPALLVLGAGAGGSDGEAYLVRAIFDNAAAAVPGEDVKVAGAKVGVIDSMDVTADKKAALTLRIDDSRFAPFRSDASCRVRPQSLIGEKLVECDPGTAGARPLERIDAGEGRGEHLLPLRRTESTVDLDLVNDTLRRPYAERFSILLSELGTGLAGRGEQLNEAIHRANPALRETDRVLAILARQNRVLADLARDSDRVLAPLARHKERVSGFVEHANETARATAARRADIERDIERLPPFLRELRPLMADLGGFAGEAAPVVRDLNVAGEDVSRVIERLGPFARAATPSLTSLGEAAESGRPALIRARPLIGDLGRFAADARPASTDLDRLTQSFDRTGGIERLMDLLFFSTLAVNGFDSASHYLRAGLLVNTCTSYAVAPTPGCAATFTKTRAIGAGAQSRAQPRLAAQPAPARGSAPGEGSVPVPPGGLLGELLGAAGTAEAASPSAGAGAEPLLDYLLGDDGP